jgi:hypothetical protein
VFPDYVTAVQEVGLGVVLALLGVAGYAWLMRRVSGRTDRLTDAQIEIAAKLADGVLDRLHEGREANGSGTVERPGLESLVERTVTQAVPVVMRREMPGAINGSVKEAIAPLRDEVSEFRSETRERLGYVDTRITEIQDRLGEGDVRIARLEDRVGYLEDIGKG